MRTLAILAIALLACGRTALVAPAQPVVAGRDDDAGSMDCRATQALGCPQ